MGKYLNLRRLRQSLGFTQVVFASEIGLAQGYLSELESGKKKITDDVINKVIGIFGSDIVEPWMKEVSDVQQNVEGDSNNFSGTGNVTVEEGKAVPLEAFNRMLDEYAEQRKIINKAQDQIDRLIALLERKS